MPYDNAAQILGDTFTTHDVRVPNRFNGPPGSGNGGWSAALLGKHVGPEVVVTDSESLKDFDLSTSLAPNPGVQFPQRTSRTSMAPEPQPPLSR